MITWLVILFVVTEPVIESFWSFKLFGHFDCFGNLLSSYTVSPWTVEAVTLWVPELDIFLISYFAWQLMRIIFSVAYCRWKLHKFRDRINSYCVLFLVCPSELWMTYKAHLCFKLYEKLFTQYLFNSCRLFILKLNF